MPVVFRDSLESLLITSSEYIDYDGLERIRKAYEFTVESNKRYDMLRFSGEPSIVHPLSVAEQLVKWRLDSDTIAAGILHDTIEDPEVHAVQLHATFGEAVTRMVDGVSKLKKFELPKKANPDTAFMWKIFLATASDIRVALIKIADRLHNMRTLESMPGYKTIKNCIETEKIFIPLAERLGMEALVEEMQDICFQYLHPNEYSNLIEYIDNIIDSESEILESSIEKLRPSLSALNIEYQIKPFYYSHSHINRIMDETNPMTMIKTGLIEITVPDDEECYLALRAVHKTFRNFSMNFQDIIAFPSTAMKRMLQTVVLAPGGLPMVTRILSREMKHINRYGIVPFIAEKHTLKRSDFLEERVNWLQKTITENRALVGEKDQAGLVDIMSRTLTEKETFVFYANRLVELPESSSVLDFAYSIGPEIGNHISAVFINRQEVTLDYIPKRFDQLSFETNPAGSPRVEWLECVNTLEAQIQIKTKLRELDRYEAIAEGRGALLKRARENGLCPSGRIEDLDRLLKNVAFSFQINDLDDIYEEIGYGKLEMSLVLDVFRKRYTQIIEVEDWEADASITKDPIFQRPIETSLIKCEKQLKARLFLGELCAPLPGDDIEVSVTGKRMVVHRAGCPHRSRYFLRGRKYPATWGKTNGRLFPARIKLKIFPTKTIFQKTLELFEKNKIEVIASRTGIQSDEGLELIEFIIGVKNTEDLNNIKEELLKLRDVVAFRRI